MRVLSIVFGLHRIAPWFCFIYHITLQEPDEFELEIAEELLRLESSSAEFKASLGDLYISAAKEVECGAGGKAIIVYVPYKLKKSFNAIQAKLVRELEKKFSGAHVLIIAQRTIMGKNFSRKQGSGSLRPRSRTLTAVQDAILEDIVFPTEIEAKRTRCKLDGSKTLKVYLNSKDQANVEPRIATYASVYQKLTNKQVQFMFN